MGPVTSRVSETSSVSYQSICGGSSEEHRTGIFKDDSNLHSWPLQQLTVREIPGQTVHCLPQISAADWYVIGQGKKSAQMFRLLMLSQEHCGIFWLWQGLDLIQHYVITREENYSLDKAVQGKQHWVLQGRGDSFCSWSSQGLQIEEFPAISVGLFALLKMSCWVFNFKKTLRVLGGLDSNSTSSILPFSCQRM